jgi:hypothetical protein
MSKGALRTWSVIALVSGLCWIALSHPPPVVAVGIVLCSLCLCGLSWRKGL